MHILSLLIACGGGESADVSVAAPAPAEPAPVAEKKKTEKKADDGSLARGDDSERKSKNGTTKMKLGDVDVTVTYGRPAARGRALFGELIPYDEVWRTGADEATVLTVSGPVKLGETTVPAGSYALFTIPGEEEWTILLNSQAKQWGSYERDAKLNVAKAVAKVEKVEKDQAAEMFTIANQDDTLYLHWGQVKVPVPLSAG